MEKSEINCGFCENNGNLLIKHGDAFVETTCPFCVMMDDLAKAETAILTLQQRNKELRDTLWAVVRSQPNAEVRVAKGILIMMTPTSRIEWFEDKAEGVAVIRAHE